MARPTPEQLVAATRRGDRSALARVLSLVERGGDEAREVGRALHGQGGDAYTVGITGAPGAGKSTLTSALVDLVRASGERVAVLAIDPSSPFSGGAILGDRVRMGDHALDEGVFIRSMATRGHLGGLAVAAPEAVRVLTAAGYPWVLLETVGVGQVEVEVVGQADTTLVVVNPGLGRRGAGEQGRAHGDRRRLRGQQGRPARAPRRPPATSSACSTWRSGRAAGGRRSCAPPPSPATGWPTCGRRWSTTAPTSRRPASWPSAAGAGPPRR